MTRPDVVAALDLVLLLVLRDHARHPLSSVHVVTTGYRGHVTEHVDIGVDDVLVRRDGGTPGDVGRVSEHWPRGHTCRL